jgi:hydrogenase expression/formation protein HypD
MKYLDEYRDPETVKRYSEAIKRTVTRPWTLMEMCGGQTHAIIRFGLDELLPTDLELVHGPGCPVCVTPVALIDKAIELSMKPGVTLCSFGDMLRVPGSQRDLHAARAEGGSVRIVFSPLDAVVHAQKNPAEEVVFFAVGFETTAPANAMAVEMARQGGLTNFSVLVAHVLVPPAIEAILRSPKNRVQGFLAAGHVCTVMGWEEYFPIAERHEVPIVVTGFEPADLLQGVLMCVKQLEAGRHEVENQYRRSVQMQGNDKARHLVEKVFEVTDREWRGIGNVPQSGYRLSKAYRRFDALERFGELQTGVAEDSACIAAQVLQGHAKPRDCPAFGKRCTPENPLGAPMVSNEGACAAYYRYRRSAS